MTLYYATDILSEKRVEFEAESFKDAKLYTTKNLPPELHFVREVNYEDTLERLNKRSKS